MTSPCPVLAGYRLLRSGPCTCLSSMYVQNLLATYASAVVGLHSLLSVLDHFLVSFSFMACPIWGWALLGGGLCFFFSAHPSSYYYLLPYYFIIPAAEFVLFQSGWTLLGLPFILPLMAQQDHWFLCYITSGLPCPICFTLGDSGLFCFPQASSALFLISHHHELLLNSLGFPGPITLFLILGVYGLAMNSLLSLFSLL